jgi:hypothetical protein
MTKGEYEAKVKILEYLIFVRRQYELLHGTVDDTPITRGFNIEGFTSVSDIELNTGISVALIRNALKGCDLVVSRTGKAGGYRLSVAPNSLQHRANAIAFENDGKSPIKWVRVVPLTLDDLIGEYVEGLIKFNVFYEDIVTDLIVAARKKLKKKVLYEFRLTAFGVRHE